MKRIICVTGYAFTGKTTIAQSLANQIGADFIGVSDVVRKVMKVGVDAPRELLQNSNKILLERGKGESERWLANALITRIRNKKKNIVVLAGPRETEVCNKLKEKFMTVSIALLCGKFLRLRRAIDKGELEEMNELEDIDKRDDRIGTNYMIYSADVPVATSDLTALENRPVRDIVDDICQYLISVKFLKEKECHK